MKYLKIFEEYSKLYKEIAYQMFVEKFENIVDFDRSDLVRLSEILEGEDDDYTRGFNLHHILGSHLSKKLKNSTPLRKRYY